MHGRGPAPSPRTNKRGKALAFVRYLDPFAIERTADDRALHDLQHRAVGLLARRIVPALHALGRHVIGGGAAIFFRRAQKMPGGGGFVGKRGSRRRPCRSRTRRMLPCRRLRPAWPSRGRVHSPCRSRRWRRPCRCKYSPTDSTRSFRETARTWIDPELCLRRFEWRSRRALQLVRRADCLAPDRTTAAVRCLPRRDHLPQSSATLRWSSKISSTV